MNARPTVQEVAANLEYVTGSSRPIRERYGIEQRPKGVKHERDSLWCAVGDRIIQATSQETGALAR